MTSKPSKYDRCFHVYTMQRAKDVVESWPCNTLRKDHREALDGHPFASPPAPDAALRRVLNRLQNAVNRWPGDWSTDHRLAYIWAVVNSGWGDEVYAEMSKTLSADWIKAMREDEGVLEAALSAQPAEHK